MTELKDQRDREVARTAGRKMASPFSAKVVGVSFVEGYPDNLHELNRLTNPPGLKHYQANGEAAQDMLDSSLREDVEALMEWTPPKAAFVRNPDNEYDENAIEVHVEGVGMIGHLTRPIAARLAPELDAGQVWLAQVEEVLIDPDHMDRPGISINCKRGD